MQCKYRLLEKRLAIKQPSKYLRVADSIYRVSQWSCNFLIQISNSQLPLGNITFLEITYCSLRRVRLHAHAQAQTQISWRVQFIARAKSLYFHFVLSLLYIFRKEKLFIERFRCSLVSSNKQAITYYYLRLTYFYVRTFTNKVSVPSQPEPPGLYIDSWRCTVPLRVEPHCQLPSLLVYWS